MWPSIVLAAVVLFSQSGIHAQHSCTVVETTVSFRVSSDNHWSVRTYWGNSVNCKLQVVDPKQVTVYGSSECKANQFCQIPLNISPQCENGSISDDELILQTDCKEACVKSNSERFKFHPTKINCTAGRQYIECQDKNICPIGENSSGPGCYCKDGLYLSQPTFECMSRSDSRCFPSRAITVSTNLFVPPCTEVGRGLAFTWNPLLTPINKYEVRDYTGDLVVSANTDTDAAHAVITAPPVGIYEVTVFGVAENESFNESAKFSTNEESMTVEKVFIIHVLPDGNGITVCFSSAQKDVSYLCQEGSGAKEPCTDCKSYSRANGMDKITVYMLGNGVEVAKQSFDYRV